MGVFGLVELDVPDDGEGSGPGEIGLVKFVRRSAPFAALAFAVVLVVGVAVLVSHEVGDEAGSMADWVEALATVAALAAAAAAAWYAARTFNSEQRRDRERVQEASRSQAVKVTAWAHAEQGGRVNFAFGPEEPFTQSRGTAFPFCSAWGTPPATGATALR